MSTTTMNIDPDEARKRIDALEAVFTLAHQYARIPRATLMADGTPETDGEHGLSLAMIATAYAMVYHPELDPYKVFFYGVMHDIDEFLHGDTPTLKADDALFSVKEAQEAEAKAERKKILAAFPMLNGMIDSLDDLSIPEHAFTKAFDKLAPGYTHAANLGVVLKERYDIHTHDGILEATKLTDDKMRKYAAHFPDVIAMRAAMHQKVAEIAFGDK